MLNITWINSLGRFCLSSLFLLQDIILLGDFNTGCSYVTSSEWVKIRLFTDKSYHWLITDDVDTTVSNTVCPYDR